MTKLGHSRTHTAPQKKTCQLHCGWHHKKVDKNNCGDLCFKCFSSSLPNQAGLPQMVTSFVFPHPLHADWPASPTPTRENADLQTRSHVPTQGRLHLVCQGGAGHWRRWDASSAARQFLSRIFQCQPFLSLYPSSAHVMIGGLSL